MIEMEYLFPREMEVHKGGMRNDSYLKREKKIHYSCSLFFLFVQSVSLPAFQTEDNHRFLSLYSFWSFNYPFWAFFAQIKHNLSSTMNQCPRFSALFNLFLIALRVCNETSQFPLELAKN